MNEYYIPDIKDIRIGYECEVVDNGGNWSKMIIDQPHLRSIAFEERQLEEGHTRVPYLTPELLEKEGWEFKETVKINNFGQVNDVYIKGYSDAEAARRKDGWMMDGYSYTWKLYAPNFKQFGTWHGAGFIIEMKKRGGFMGEHSKYPIFHGKLPSVNELRYISKLANIKDYE